MKYGVYLALIGVVSAIHKGTQGTGMSEESGPVARSSEDLQSQSLAQAQHGDSSDDEKAAGAKDAQVKPVANETFQPELSMHKTYDMDNAQGGILRADATRMKVKVKTAVKGKYCAEDEYVVGYWKKWNGTDGTKMEDVKESGDGRPAVFKIGHFQVSKCLDLAAQQMHAGETAKVTCPGDLDQGGDVQNLYRNSYNGNYYLDKTTTTKYELEITECALKPKYMEQKDDMESLVSGFPFYIVSNKVDADGDQLVITADPADQYAPRSTGVHNVYLDKHSGKKNPNKMQQWIWNAEEQSLRSVGLPAGALFEGFNQNMIVYNWRGLHNQRFKYNKVSQKMTNAFTGNAMDVFMDKLIPFQNINTNEPDYSTGQVWIIDYQSEDHGHDHHD